MKRLDFYWKSDKSWYHWDDKFSYYVINDDAPEEAKESYKHYLEQIKGNCE